MHETLENMINKIHNYMIIEEKIENFCYNKIGDNMWFIFTLITFIAWGLADLYYKLGNSNDKYSHIKTGIIVGLIMGIHATIFMIFNKESINLIEIIKYLPVSLCYIASMVIGYKGLRYLELSISSPIQNSSGIITSILLCLIFKIKLSYLEILGIIVIFIGVLILSILEIKEGKQEKIIGSFKCFIVIFPIIYAIIDGLGTFLDAIYLDQLELISENSALIAYEYTFLIYGIIMLIYLKIKKEPFKLFGEITKIKAALLETLGQFTYVYAISKNSVIAVPIISCYSALSVLLSRFYLKEKLSILSYIAIIIIFIGIILLGILEEI